MNRIPGHLSFDMALQKYKDFKDVSFRGDLSDTLLNDYHPDYILEQTTRLSTGGNSGDHCVTELASVLQADSPLDIKSIPTDTEKFVDVLVIGGGGAGCVAALSAAENGTDVLIATKLNLGDSNTIMAEGGIQAVVNTEDSIQQHFKDTMQSSYYKAEKDLTATMIQHGPESIKWLIELGMKFDTDENGNLLARKGGGATFSRVVYFKDYTGLELMRVLRSTLSQSAVSVLNHSPVIELLSDNGRCTGAVLLDLVTKRIKVIRAKSVVLATGGSGRIHINNFPTSNHVGATADGLSLAYRLGAKLRELDSFQYHPTGIIYPESLAGTLVTEGLRSAGARLLNAQGERFVDELNSRDIVSAAIIRECENGRGVDVSPGVKGVWLDTPELERNNPGILKKQFPKLLSLAKNNAINPVEQPVLVYPTLHYQNGGICINTNGVSTVSGLYSTGEVSGGVHGRNRLMGNALLEVISLGRITGKQASMNAKKVDFGDAGVSHLENWRAEREQFCENNNEIAPKLFPDYFNFKY